MFNTIIVDFYLAFKIMFFVFVSSTSTVILYCKINNCPFYVEDNHIQHPKCVEYNSKKESKLVTILKNKAIVFTESVGCVTYLLHNNYILNEKHHFIYSGLNVTLYIVIIEFLYYSIHRLMHHRYLYNLVHKKHHEIYEVYPLDAFYVSLLDVNGTFASFIVPLVLLRLNVNEFIFVLYLYLTIIYISHSSTVFHHHIIHHKYLIYNYCLFLPIFDALFNTYK